MSQIFISYRRDDALFKADRLADRLGRQFTVFRDLDAISPGDDWERWIDTELKSCAVLLVLIGQRWLEGLRDAPNGSKANDNTDRVALEIVEGLRRQEVTVVPILLDDALMPSDTALPDALAPLAKRQAFRITDITWRVDVERLVDVIGPLVASRQLNPTSPDEDSADALRISATQRTYFAPRLDFSVLVSSVGDLYRSRGWETTVIIKESDSVLIKARPRRNLAVRALTMPQAMEYTETATAVSLEFHNDYLVAVFGSTWWVNEGHFKKKALVKGTILFGVLAAGAVYPPTRRLVLEWEKRHPVLTAGPLMGIAAATASWRGQLRRENVEREAMDIIENLIRTAGGVVTRPSA